MAEIRVEGRGIARLEGTRSWEAEEELGSGGQGTVYAARELSAGEDAAISDVIRAIRTATRPIQDEATTAALVAALRRFGSADRRRFALKLYASREEGDAQHVLLRSAAEVAALRRVSHPRIVSLEDSGVLKDMRPFAVFPLFKRGSLLLAHQEYAGRPVDCLRAISSILEGIAHLHAAKFIHRDLKPENVFVADDGGLVVGDFGLVFDAERETSLTRVGENVGNWRFGPDWGHGDPSRQRDPRVDLYAASKILWWLASGKALLRREDWDEPQFNLTVLFPAVRDMVHVNAVLRRGLASRAEDMGYATATEMQAHVNSLIKKLETNRHEVLGAPRACGMCRSGTYVLDKTGEWTHLRNWRAETDMDPVRSTGRVVGLDMHRCDTCGHLAWYATHPEPGARVYSADQLLEILEKKASEDYPGSMDFGLQLHRLKAALKRRRGSSKIDIGAEIGSIEAATIHLLEGRPL